MSVHAWSELTPELAARFARLALSHVTREYPNKLDHVMNGPGDVRAPHELHPVFYGSFDWHSCVHGYWLLTRVERRFPELPEAATVRALFDAQLTDALVAGEVAYLQQPERGTFERPYGWAWLLRLQAELPEGGPWATALDPLARALARRFVEYLARATYPVRSGAHANTAFALTLAIDYALARRDEDLLCAARDRAVDWYARDRDCPGWEPSGDDFLSPALMEAECMRRVLDSDAYRAWLDAFLPRLATGEPATLLEPATVSDRTDGKIAHLDGLNLSRAWCMRGIARSLAEDDPRGALLERAAERHLGAALPHVAGDYAGEHWLATYAVLALTVDG